MNKLKSSIHLTYCGVYKKSTLISMLLHETKICVIINNNNNNIIILVVLI